MQTPSGISCKRRRFPPAIVAHAVWLYVRFNLSLREVEEMLLERRIDVSYETIRRWSRISSTSPFASTARHSQWALPFVLMTGSSICRLSAEAGRFLPDTGGELMAEAADPVADRFVGNRDAAQTQGEAVIRPNGIADDATREAEAFDPGQVFDVQHH